MAVVDRGRLVSVLSSILSRDLCNISRETWTPARTTVQRPANFRDMDLYPIGSMDAIYANIGGILMVNATIYSIHGSYGYGISFMTEGESRKVVWS